MITEKTGLVTYSGATFKALTSWATPYGYEAVMERFVEAKKELGKEDEEFKTINPGVCQGRLIGGNLSLTANMSSRKIFIRF